jgi:hypothetical protein
MILDELGSGFSILPKANRVTWLPGPLYVVMEKLDAAQLDLKSIILNIT